MCMNIYIYTNVYFIGAFEMINEMKKMRRF